MPADKITKEEFIQRFVEHMVNCAGTHFEDGSSIEGYAREVAPSYYAEWAHGPYMETPGDCAESDMSYWGEEG